MCSMCSLLFCSVLFCSALFCSVLFSSVVLCSVQLPRIVRVGAVVGAALQLSEPAELQLSVWSSKHILAPIFRPGGAQEENRVISYRLHRFTRFSSRCPKDLHQLEGVLLPAVMWVLPTHCSQHADWRPSRGLLWYYIQTHIFFSFIRAELLDLLFLKNPVETRQSKDICRIWSQDLNGCPRD